jgi:microcystin-dependent protein
VAAITNDSLEKEERVMKKVAILSLPVRWVVLAGATHASAQGKGNSPGIVQRGRAMKSAFSALVFAVVFLSGFVGLPSAMAQEPFVGEIRWVAFNFAPVGWAKCNGQLLPIDQNIALFSLLGITYGGDGETTFALPNLQGRVAIHEGQGVGLTSRNVGDMGGSEQQTLTVGQLPAHSHSFSVPASTNRATTTNPKGAVIAASPFPIDPEFTTTANTSLSSGQTSNTGGNQPFNTMPPFVALNCIIALQGSFPAQQ